MPASLVPDPVPLPELLAIALMQRPELASCRSEVRTALYELSLSKVLPFSPTVILGFSTGGFGGGTNLVSSPPGFVSGDGTRVIAPRLAAWRIGRPSTSSSGSQGNRTPARKLPPTVDPFRNVILSGKLFL